MPSGRPCPIRHPLRPPEGSRRWRPGPPGPIDRHALPEHQRPPGVRSRASATACGGDLPCRLQQRLAAAWRRSRRGGERSSHRLVSCKAALPQGLRRPDADSALKGSGQRRCGCRLICVGPGIRPSFNSVVWRGLPSRCASSESSGLIDYPVPRTGLPHSVDGIFTECA
jgi:hypothetical protein